jgi:hypothetical protein
MHKILSFLFVLLFAGVLLAAELPPKDVDNYVAVFNLDVTGKVDKDISSPLTQSIRRALVLSGKYEVIDRSNMDKIIEERKFQSSGCIGGACAVEAGQILGVRKIVVGSVGLIGKTYYLSLSLIDAQSGKIESVAEDKCKCEVDELIDSTKKLVARLVNRSRQVALDYRAKIDKWDAKKDSYREFKSQLDKLIELNQDGDWYIGWGLTKDGRSYRLQWRHNEFFFGPMTMEEAIDKKLGEYQTKFRQYESKNK